MIGAETLPDIVLAPLLVWVAWRTQATPDPFRAVVLFIAFGLLMTLAWVRLGAPDAALAETAIGTGLTGAMLLDAVGQFAGKGGRRGREGAGKRSGRVE
jgi:energy-converting hydrogenase B subunit D